MICGGRAPRQPCNEQDIKASAINTTQQRSKHLEQLLLAARRLGVRVQLQQRAQVLQRVLLQRQVRAPARLQGSEDSVLTASPRSSTRKPTHQARQEFVEHANEPALYITGDAPGAVQRNGHVQQRD